MDDVAGGVGAAPGRGGREVELADADPACVLAPLALLPGDPTVRLAPVRFVRATWTPEGPGAVEVTWRAGAAVATVVSTGDGAGWLDRRAEALLGRDDDPSGFEPRHDAVRRLWRRFAGDRVGRTGALWHDLAWWVVQQRVSRADAAAQWRRLVTAHGTPAPGHPDLLVPPSPRQVASLGYAALHPLGIERRRAETLAQAARATPRLAALVDGPLTDAERALRAVPGIGAWTTAGLAATTWGHADTVITGDAGIPSLVAWLLAGEPRADDARMLALLEPYRPHRYRVVRLAFLGGVRAPRRGPRGRGHDVRRR